MADVDPDELIGTVVTHREVLRSLKASAKTKPELLEECGVSRSTIDRWLTELESADLVDRPNDKFTLTLYGRLITQQYIEMQSRVTQLMEAQSALATLADETSIDPQVFEHANVASYSGLAPQITDELLGHPGRVRVVAPIVPIVYGMLMFDDPHPDLELELLIDTTVVEQLKRNSFTHQNAFSRTANIDLFTIDDPPSVSLALVERGAETELYLIVWGPVNNVVVIKNKTPEAIDWGESIYHEYREQSNTHDPERLIQ